jgi:hypothetical protein
MVVGFCFGFGFGFGFGEAIRLVSGYYYLCSILAGLVNNTTNERGGQDNWFLLRFPAPENNFKKIN